MLLLLVAGSSVCAQQKANFKLADRFSSRNFRSADRNSMSIWGMFLVLFHDGGWEALLPRKSGEEGKTFVV